MNKNKEYTCVHYVSNFLPLTEIWIYNQIKFLQTAKPVVICRDRSNEKTFPATHIFCLNKKPKLFSLLNLSVSRITGFIPFFSSVCKKTDCKILHVHFGNNGVKFTGLSRHLKTPLVCSFYGADAFKYPYQDTGNRQKLQNLFKYSSTILVLGPYMKNALMELGCPADKIIIHHLGIETSAIEFKKREFDENKPTRFLMASSFVEKKGIDICLKALSLVKNRINFTIDIIGDGVLKEEIIRLVDELELKDKITFHGYKDYSYMLELAMSCHAFLQASRTSSENDKEGTPMVMVDVMATGLPIISTNHSDIPEIVEDGITGFLAEENDIDSFAQKITEFWDKRENISTMSINCRKKVESNFDAKKQSSILNNIYNNLINTGV